LSWTKSILLASLLIVTGPAVVIPLLRKIQVKEKLHTILKGEAILVDPLGVIVAVVLFQFLTSEDVGLLKSFVLFGVRLAAGVLIGLAAGWTMTLGLTKNWLLRLEGEDLGGLFLLAAALFFYGIGEAVLPHTGLVVVTAAGIYIGNKRFAFREQIFNFKKQITLIALSGLFILLSSGIPFHAMGQVAGEGFLLLAILILVARPLGVFLSTSGSGFDFREKIFLASLAPRGIVSAALASLFVLAFESKSLPGEDRFLPLAFFLIVGTILVYTLITPSLAKILGVCEEKGRGVLIIGAGAFGRLLGRALREAGISVFFMDTNPEMCRDAEAEDFQALQGSGFDRDFIESIDLKGIGKVVAVTSNHEVNVLSCQVMSRYLGRNSVFRFWSEGDVWENVSADSYEDAWGKPLMTFFRESEGVLESLESGQIRVLCKKLESPLVMNPENLRLAGIEYPLFAVSGKDVFFCSPKAVLPAGSQLYFLFRPIALSAPYTR
jgi:NhaP-type Na+/H+ or K+/H+ antiporter